MHKIVASRRCCLPFFLRGAPQSAVGAFCFSHVSIIWLGHLGCYLLRLAINLSVLHGTASADLDDGTAKQFEKLRAVVGRNDANVDGRQYFSRLLCLSGCRYSLPL